MDEQEKAKQLLEAQSKKIEEAIMKIKKNYEEWSDAKDL